MCLTDDISHGLVHNSTSALSCSLDTQSYSLRGEQEKQIITHKPIGGIALHICLPGSVDYTGIKCAS